MMRKILLTILIAGCFCSVSAADTMSAKPIEEQYTVATVPDSVSHLESESFPANGYMQHYDVGDSTLATPNLKPNVFQKVLNYLLTDKDHSNDRFWISFLGGPHYDTDTKLGLAVLGNLFFRHKSCEFSTQPSFATLRFDFSTSGYVSTRLQGSTLFADDKRRLNYEVEFESLPSYFWGIGYEACDNSDNKSAMDRKQAHIVGEFLWRVAPKSYLGPAVKWDWVNADAIDKMYLLDGQPLTTRSYGFGFTADFDGRDQITNAERGLYIHAGVLFFPKKLWNDYSFTRVDTRICYYHPLWRGAVFATEIKSQFNFGNPSWVMMAQPGDSYTLRGYYRGRYRDKHAITLQAELRQPIWDRLGAAVWCGGGSVFRDADGLKNLLPNVGIGLRWAFRKRMNVRVDYGWGRSGEHGFIFAMNEAF